MNNPELQVHTLKCDELVPYAGNAKVHTPEQVEQIAASIREFGNCDPIAVWHDQDGVPVIVEGHGRLMALQKLGIETAPVIYLDHLTDEQRRAYTHVHNQTTLSSGFDLDALAADMADLPGVDWDSFGFGEYAGENPIYDEDAISEVDVPDDVEPRAVRGQVWSLGGHRLMCGDSTSRADLEKLLGGVRPKMVFTDPPYGVAIGSKNAELKEVTGKGSAIEKDIEGDTLAHEELQLMLTEAFRNLHEHSDEACSYYVSVPQGGELGLVMYEMMRDAGLPVRHSLVWVKNGATFSLGRLDYDYRHEAIFYTWDKKHDFVGGYDNSVIDDNKPLERMSKAELKELVHALREEANTSVIYEDKPKQNDLHPTMKPVKLVARFMHNSSRMGDPVADIFGGSGTTLMAAEQLGRKCYMMELDPHYCDIIIERWEQFTGKRAVLA